MGITFNIGLDASFENMQVCKGVQMKARDANSLKTYATNSETFYWMLKGVTLITLFLYIKWLKIKELINY